MSSDGFERSGFTLLHSVFNVDEASCIITGVEAGLASSPEAVRSSQGAVYAARNILDVWPESRSIWLKPALVDFLSGVLGDSFGLVRGLYFDKPPDRTWSLPWHQDLTVAVKQHRSVDGFAKPTTKEGVPHFEASTDLLERMATVRIHLDPVSEDNGPLEVLEGSHLHGKKINLDAGAVRAIHAETGDCLVMRPLLVHSSGPSKEGTMMHRRILHLEFAADGRPAEGLEWRWFVPLQDSRS
jgi:ectoine hydroxylase-related dioxygenase (phytanoyl-CoA dioxygenase family)